VLQKECSPFCIATSSGSSLSHRTCISVEWPRESWKLRFHSGQEMMLESLAAQKADAALTDVLNPTAHDGLGFLIRARRPYSPADPNCTEIEDQVFALPCSSLICG